MKPIERPGTGSRLVALGVFLCALGCALPNRAYPRTADGPEPDASKALRARMAEIADVTHGPVGAAAVVIEDHKPVIALNGEQHLPMQSVYKLPIAMAVLHQVDLGRLTLDRKIAIRKSALFPAPTYSQIRDTYPNGTSLSIRDLLRFMVMDSDNTACDILLGVLGGPQHVTAYVRGLGIKDMVIATTERASRQSESVQYKNWATPDAMLQLLRRLQTNSGLTPSSRALLLQWMTNATTGPHRIKGDLPAGTVVAHRTGSSGTVGGIMRATNDAGLIALPNGKHLAIVVFVSDTRANEAVCEAVIAKIARAAYDDATRVPKS